VTTTHDPEPESALESALPEMPQKRDLLGNFCFYLHFAVMIFVVLGWLIPWRPVLIFYLVLLPAMVAQWRFNKNSCVLNNTESWLRTGQWRDLHNVEEGAWLKTLAENTLGLKLVHWQVDAFTYTVMALLWLLGLGHFLRWAG
jgi:hypothetical protein